MYIIINTTHAFCDVDDQGTIAIESFDSGCPVHEFTSYKEVSDFFHNYFSSHDQWEDEFFITNINYFIEESFYTD